jgi:hypothetical protein
MTKPTLEIRDGSILGLAAKRFEFDCVHGQTSTVFLPGRGHHGYEVALELLIACHERQHGCMCPTGAGSALDVLGPRSSRGVRQFQT